MPLDVKLDVEPAMHETVVELVLRQSLYEVDRAYPAPESVVLVVGGPEVGKMLRVAVVTVYGASMMKFVPVVPCETSTKLLADAGTFIITPAGMAPPAVEVKVVPVPLGQATAVDWKQYA